MTSVVGPAAGRRYPLFQLGFTEFKPLYFLQCKPLRAGPVDAIRNECIFRYFPAIGREFDLT